MQNLKNHSRIVPLYHYVLYLLLAVILAFSIINLTHTWHHPELHMGGAILFVISIALLLSAWFIRSFSLKAQDRAIRAEENLRHYVLTGKLLDSRLILSQIIALRFAPDEEFVALAKKAADTGISNKEIKQSINNWKADNDRV